MRPTVLRIGFVAIALFLAVQVSVAQEETPEGEQVNPLVDAGLTIVEAPSLDDLLQLMREKRLIENEMERDRLQRFEDERNNQQVLLDDAEADFAREQQRSRQLDAQQAENETEIANQQTILDDRLGSLRELFGVLQQVSGDARGVFNGSIVSTELPDRHIFLNDLAAKMGTASQLATVDEMEHLIFLLMQHLRETGRISRFVGTVQSAGGDQVEQDVLRIGAFNVVTQNGYVNYDVATGNMIELPRQPSAEFTNTARGAFRSDTGDMVGFAVDPTRGALLSLETQRATFGEMVGSPLALFQGKGCWLPFCDGQGGMVGSVIILVGIVGVLLAIERLIMLTLISQKVSAQRNDPGNPREDNPLGRVIGIYHANKEVDNETLQLKMGEAVLRETPALTRNIAIVQVISVVAPLMGLLGTVIGMIQTFQAITLFGTGDPKIMASGISTALMTTVLGLCVAIPTVLLHALVSQYSRSVLHVLDEQSEGIIAQHAEQAGDPISDAKAE
ncbi:MAG: MotA/TolQ/ExbB proton channel family protein [Gammaproteobacteria bacterium]|nr:MotA/TolQ/ExbB proton channel family protein [Gammaproteobacteria bacterium]